MIGVLLLAFGAAGQDDEPFHRRLFANDAVTVYEVEVRPRDMMRFHAHPVDHAVVVLAGSRLRNEVAGAAPVDHDAGEAGRYLYVPAGPAHRQSNIGETTARWIGIDFHAPAARATQAPAAACQALDSGVGAQACRMRLDPGAATPWPVYEGGQLVVAVEPARFTLGGASIEVGTGAVTWLDAPRSTLTNAGPNTLHFVIVAPNR